MIKIITNQLSARHLCLGPVCEKTSEFVALLACDQNSFFYTQITLLSIFLNSKSRNFETIILISDLSADAVASFSKLADRFSRSITILQVSSSASSALASTLSPIIDNLHFIASNIIDAAAIAYIGSNCIAQIDISEIFLEHRSGLALGGVEARFEAKAKHPIGKETHQPYIIDGVFLLTPSRWREIRALEKWAGYLSGSRRQLVRNQQDALNAALLLDKYTISPKWNISVKCDVQEDASERKVEVAGRNGVVRFSGRTKPWSEWCHPSIRDYYLSFAGILGLPDNYWRPPQTHADFYWKARMAELEGDYVAAAVGYRQLIWEGVRTGRLDLPGFRIPEGFRLRSS